MLWGYMKLFGDRDIVVIAGNSNLATNLVLSETYMIENIYLDEVFQQDNAGCYNSKLVTIFFRQKGFQILKNGPHNLHVSGYGNRRFVKNNEQLTIFFHRVFKTFLAILDNLFHRLYRSIPRRIIADLKNNVVQTKN